MSPNIPSRRRALNVLALLLPLVLAPLPGSAQNAPPGADSHRSSRTPTVYMKLAKQQVTAKQRARVKIALGTRSARSHAPGALQRAALGSGKVAVVVVGKKGKPRTIGGTLVKGKDVVRLPKLRPGIYKVRARFLGNQLLGRAKSKIRTLRVVGAGGGGGGGAAGCASSTPYSPDGPDGSGGCFPGTANTGPTKSATAMATYSGSCTISTPNVVIDSKVVNCRTLNITSGGSGFVLRNSYLNGSIVQSGGAAPYTVQDSFIDSGVQFPACSDGSCPAGKYACGDLGNTTSDCGVNGSNFTILRTEIINTNRAAYCERNCLIQDSYFHGTNLWPDPSNGAHASSVRMEQGLTLRHSSIHCSFTGPFTNGDIGCSADLTGYPDFTAIKNNTIDANLFVASPRSGFCAYGGATPDKPYSGDPTNATNQKFTNNVFQRGANRKCGSYGPVTNFDKSRSGNAWSGNIWDDGTAVAASN
jgi:hypothetical protein